MLGQHHMTQVRVCARQLVLGYCLGSVSHLLEIIRGILVFIVQYWAWASGYHAFSAMPNAFFPSSGVPHGPGVPCMLLGFG